MEGNGAANQSQRTAVLLVVAVFVLGIALGVLGTYLEGYRVFGSGMLHRQPVDHSPAAQQRGRQARVDHMTKDLNLTADQQSKIKPILVDQQKKMEDLRNDSNTDRKAMRDKMLQIRKDASDQIRALLDDKQKEKFDKQEEQRDDRMENRRGGRPGGPGGQGGDNSGGNPPATAPPQN